MTYEITQKQLENKWEIGGIIFNCQFGDVYIHEETGEILFMEDEDGWKSLSKEFAEVLRNEYNHGWWRVVFDDGKNEVHVKNVDDLEGEERVYLCSPMKLN